MTRRVQLAIIKPARWPFGRSIRAAISIGLAFSLGVLSDDIMPGMWIGMGALMCCTAEGARDFRSNLRILIISTPFGAAGFLLGYLTALPWVAVVCTMSAVGFAAGVMSTWAKALSIGMLQMLLMAAIAIGVPQIAPFWSPAGFYLLGALWYLSLFATEALLMHLRRPQHRPLEEASPATGAQQPAVKPPAAAASDVWGRITMRLNDRHGQQSGAALALCLGIAYASHWINDASHWFWVPLTVGLAMKPDLGPVFDRAILRCLGSAIGVIIGALILFLIPKGLWIALIIGLLAAALPWAMATSYAMQAVFLTPLVLLLVDIIIPGAASIDYGAQRLVDTLVGCAIALVIGQIFWRRHPQT